MRSSILSLVILSLVPAIAQASPRAKGAPAALEVTSPAFDDGAPIPKEYTCDGDQLSPPLAWSKAPAGTQSIAILVEDPDAPKGTFTHWLVTGIAPTVTSLRRGTALPDGAIAAKNDKDQAGYTGPCPPSGQHHYRFSVFALDTTLPSKLDRVDFRRAIDGHVLAAGVLVGTYAHR